MHKFLFALCILLSLNSCEQALLDADFVYVRHKGADMPVWVNGNTDSGVFIIYLHGGPGGSSFIDIQNDFFGGIAEEYAMVYYDQRASGNSLGQNDVALLTIEQFVEDLDVIVQFIQSTYNPSKLILLGHSWGGTLGAAYLLEPNLQAKIDAWIEVDGGHNLGLSAYEYSRDYVLDAANRSIDNNMDVEEWESIKEYYEDLDSWRDPEVVLQHSKYVGRAGGYFYDPEALGQLVGLNQVFFSETDFIALLVQNKHVIKNMDVWHLDFTDRLAEIEIPTLILWGKADGILPRTLAYEAKEAMNLGEEFFYIFEASAHSPHYEETVLFNQKVIDFIKNHVE